MILILVLSASIILQLVAAYLALRLIRLTQERTAWLLIAAAISLMALRRIIAFYRLVSRDMSNPPDLVAELVALVISILIVSGIAFIRPLFLSIKNNEEVLRRIQDSQRLAERIAHLGYWDWNIVSNELSWSGEIYNIFGLKPDEFGGTYEAFIDSVHPEDRESVQEAVNAALYENKTYSIQHRVIMPSGEECTVHERAEVTFNKEGKPIRMFGIVQDITKLIQSEEVRRKSEIRFATIQNISSDAIIMVSQDQIINNFNQGAESIFGYRAEEVIDQPLDILLPTHLGEIHIEHIKRFEKSGEIARQMIERREILGRRKDGSIFPAEASISKLIDGDQVSFATILRDVTERKLAAERIQHQMEHLNSLREIDLAITGSLDLRITMNVILDQVTSRLKVDAASILLLDPQTQFLEFGAVRGTYTSKEIKKTRVRVGDSFSGRAAFDRKLIKYKDLNASEVDPAFAKLMKEEQFVDYYGMPLIAKGRVKGVLEIYLRSPREPDEEWFSFFESLAAQTAIALDNASLFDDLEKLNTELVLAYDTTLVGWSKAMELRDKETEGHTQRVTSMTVRLATMLGMTSEELIHVRRGALLHDIGKMGIPDHILRKPEALTRDEWEIMKEHPLDAYKMLSPIEYLRPALDIPYCHHEKWDGSGYPRGLKGEEIPLAARIFAVADVWDALTSDRPYRKAWTKKKALKYIRDELGKHFQTEVVEKFLKLIE